MSATHARVEGADTAPQLNGKRPAQTPELTVVGQVRWSPVQLLTLSADLRFETARYEDDLNTRRLAPATSLDARAGWQLGKGLEVYLAADNVTNAKIAVAQSADGTTGYGAPRLVRVGLSLRR